MYLIILSCIYTVFTVLFYCFLLFFYLGAHIPAHIHARFCFYNKTQNILFAHKFVAYTHTLNNNIYAYNYACSFGVFLCFFFCLFLISQCREQPQDSLQCKKNTSFDFFFTKSLLMVCTWICALFWRLRLHL